MYEVFFLLLLLALLVGAVLHWRKHGVRIIHRAASGNPGAGTQPGRYED